MGDPRRAKDHYRWADRYMRYGDDQRAAAHMKRALHYYSEKAKSGFGTGPVPSPDCDKSPLARKLLEDTLRREFPEASEEEVAATVDHWFKCNCNNLAFIHMDTYPTNAIQFKDANGNTRQVLKPLMDARVAYASNKPSLSSTMTGAYKPPSYVPGNVNRKRPVDQYQQVRNPPSTQREPEVPLVHEIEEDLTDGKDGMNCTGTDDLAHCRDVSKVEKITVAFDPIFGGPLMR